MPKFVIIPDSASDINKELRERFNIPEVISYSITYPDGHDELDNCDHSEEKLNKFYSLLKDKKNKIYSGAPSPEKYIEVFEKYLKEGYDVLSISISSALSAAYSFSVSAANELKEKYPDRKILCLDSLRYSTSELLLLIYAGTCQKEGKSIEETFEYLSKIRNNIHQAGPMDDLMFLASKGRISNGKAFMGTLVGINPIGECNKEGLTTVLGKVKGSKKALNVCLQYMKETIINPNEQIVVIAHSDRKEKAELFKEMIEKEIQPKEIIFSEVGLTCAVNIGPGLCAAYYFGKEISDDLSEEKAIFNKIIGK